MAELLVLGQIDTAAVPVSGAAELYLLSGGYGSPIGTDTPLLLETTDQAFGGPAGRVSWRRVQVPVLHEGTAVVTVTPIADFGASQPSTTKTYPAPSVPLASTIMPVGVAVSCLAGRVMIAVGARSGKVQIYAPVALVRPIKAASILAVSGDAQ